jgi:putative peptide zinc metalloprotease protein
MPPPAAASDLERRKHVRLRLRGDLSIAPQKYEGRTYFVVKDPVSLRYYRFKEQEHYLLQFMDGKHTLDEAQKSYERRFRPERLTLEDLEGFAQQLLTAGLVQNESPRAGQQLYERRQKRRRTEWMQTLTNILYIKIPIIDPEKVLIRMLEHSRWIFTRLFLAASVGVMLGALLLLATHFDTFREKLPSYHEFFSFGTVINLWVALGLVKIIHEFGHGLSCKAFGGEVHEMGLLFLCFSPCMYCNVSDAWTLPDKWKRIIISSAGIYVELIIASIATFVWWNSPNHPFINNMSLSLMVVCSVSTVVFNANPLMRYDGYYVLADWLEIPNLRDRCNRYLKNLVLDKCLGIEVQPEQYMALWRRILFVVYAIVSYIYRWVVTYSILFFMYSFLKPYKLGVISGFLAMFAAGSMVGWPLFRLAKNLNRRGRLPDMNPVKVTLTTAAVIGLVLVMFVVPMPVSRVRQVALVQLQSDGMVSIPVEVAGVLERIYVRDGQYVEAGTLLAEFSSLELDIQLREEETQCENYQKQQDSLQRELQLPGDSIEHGNTQRQLAAARQDFISHETRRNFLLIQKSKLRLFAKEAGTVISIPRNEDLGKTFDVEAPDAAKAFCIIGDPTRLRVAMPISPSDYHLLKTDLKASRDGGKDLDVEIRIQGRDSETWKGRLAALPQEDAREIPGPLSSSMNGPIAVKPGSQASGRHIPQSQQYLVYIDIVDPDRAICPGNMAQVKVHCRWRTPAWWVWRTISNTFDLGLI